MSPTTHAVLIMGESRVGKSSIIARYCYGLFPYFYDPGWDRDSKDVTIDGQTHRIEIEDFSTFVTPDQPFDLRDRVIQSAEGFVLVYDVTSKASFDSIKAIHAEIRKKGRPSRPAVIVGNKCDDNDEREVIEETGRRLAKELRCRFAEVSARHGTGLEEVFLELATQINNRKKRVEAVTKMPNCRDVGQALIACLVKFSECLERMHVKILYWMYGPDTPLRIQPGPRYVEIRQIPRVASPASTSQSENGLRRQRSSEGTRARHSRHMSLNTVREEHEMAIEIRRHSHLRHGSRNTIE